MGCKIDQCRSKLSIYDSIGQLDSIDNQLNSIDIKLEYIIFHDSIFKLIFGIFQFDFKQHIKLERIVDLAERLHFVKHQQHPKRIGNLDECINHQH